MKTIVVQPDLVDPVRVTAGQTSSLDAALGTAEAGDEVVLMPGGVYRTRGPWAFEPPAYLSVPAGVTIRAGGATVRLVDPETRTVGAGGGLVDRPDHDLPILWCGAGVRIFGGTWDANQVAQRGWYGQGIRFFGRFEIRDARIIGMSGSRRSGTPSGAVESFGISSQGETSGSVVERVAVERCRVVEPNEDYVSGIYVGSTEAPPAGAVPSRVRECEVDFGGRGQFAYSSDEATIFENCVGYASRFWYSDTSNSRGTRLMGCRGRGIYAAVSAVGSNPGQGGATNDHREIVMIGGEYDFPRAVEWWDQTRNKTLTGGVLAVDVTFNCRTPWTDRSGKLLDTWRSAVVSRQGVIAFAGCRFSTEKDFVDIQGGSPRPASLDRPRLA